MTSLTMIAKIKSLGPGADSAEWIRFWNSYSLAIRQFAALKGGEENADDIVMTVLGKLVEVLRNGQYSPEKGRFHSYLATMIVNEVHMAHRREQARAAGRKVSLDAEVGGGSDEGASRTVADTLVAPGETEASIDEDWRQAVLKSAVEHVLTKTALSARDRDVYRFYVQEEHSIEETSEKFHLTRNNVSQIKTRIEKRIAAIGREMAAAAERL